MSAPIQTVNRPRSRTTFRSALTAACLFSCLGFYLQAESLSSSQITFESFLEHPPAIERMVCEEVTDARPAIPEQDAKLGHLALQQSGLIPTGAKFIPDDRVSAETNRVEIKWDGLNYLYFRSSPRFTSYVGKRNGTTWFGGPFPGGLFPGAVSVALIDPKINPAGFHAQQLNVFDAGVRRIVNLGLIDMDPGTARFDPKSHRLTASFHHAKWRGIDYTNANGSVEHTSVMPRSRSGIYSPTVRGILTADFNYSNNVPVAATISESPNSDGASPSTIRYRYSRGFYNGKLPVAFEIGGCTTRVLELTLADGPLSPDQFDPQFALPGKLSSETVWSNGLQYFRSAQNNATIRILTAKELAALRHNGWFPKLAVLSLLLSPALYLAYKLSHRSGATT